MKKYDHINFVPPMGVRKSAERGLELRKNASKSNKGGLTNKQASEHGIKSGVQRAVNLKNGDKLSPETVKAMHRFFSRHAKSAKIDEGKTPSTDKGYQAHLLWGGDAGKSWSNKIVKQMKSADAKLESLIGLCYSSLFESADYRESDSAIEFLNRHGYTPDDMSWLGEGDFGNAYQLGNDRVLKVTSSKSEASFAKQLQTTNKLDSLVKIYDMEYIDGAYFILMEYLKPVDVQHLVDIIYESGGFETFDIDDYIERGNELSEKDINYLNDIWNIWWDMTRLGVANPDIKSDNIGISKDGILKGFDIDNRGMSHKFESIEDEDEDEDEDYDLSPLNDIRVVNKPGFTFYHGTSISNIDEMFYDIDNTNSDWEGVWVTEDEQIAEEYSEYRDDKIRLVYQGQTEDLKLAIITQQNYRDILDFYGIADLRDAIPYLAEHFDGWQTTGSIGRLSYEDICVFDSSKLSTESVKMFVNDDWTDYYNVYDADDIFKSHLLPKWDGEDYTGRNIIIVDYQEEYKKNFTSNQLTKVCSLINRFHDVSNIIVMYVGDNTVGNISEHDYIMWLHEHGVNEDALSNITLIDKGYGFFRELMDNGIDFDEIIAISKWMYLNKFTDIRDLSIEDWKDLVESTDIDITEAKALLNTNAYMTIPEIMDDLDDEDNYVICGGGKDACLAEVIIALEALNKDFEVIDELVY